MNTSLDKSISALSVEKVDIIRAQFNNEKAGLAYGDTGRADVSFRWTPLRMIAHNQTGEAY